jgi:multidrug efflux pump subunit AcrA (membrane-fusion protein)
MVQFSKDGSIIRSDSAINRSERLHSSEHLVTRTYQAAKPAPIRDGIIARLFPNSEEKAIAQARLELIKTDAEFMKEALIVSRRTQIASLEEACQNYLVRQKIDARQEIDSYILEARKQLQEQLDRTSDEFIRTMVVKLKEVELIEIDMVRNVRRTQLEEDFIDFVNLQQDLIKHFRNSLPKDDK